MLIYLFPESKEISRSTECQTKFNNTLWAWVLCKLQQKRLTKVFPIFFASLWHNEKINRLVNFLSGSTNSVACCLDSRVPQSFDIQRTQSDPSSLWKTLNQQQSANRYNRAVVPKLFLIAYHLWVLYFHRIPPWKHLVPEKLNLPNIIRSNVWQTRLDANSAWTTWLWEIIMAIFRN